jgi:hypothetical protein
VDAGSVRRVSAKTMMQLADGEVVWFWRSEAGAKSAMMLTRLADDGGNQAMVTEESTYKLLKPLRREGRMIPAHLWFLPLCFFTAQGAMGATGTRPSLRPLLIPRVEFLTNSGAMSRENANVCSPSLRGALLSAEARLRAKADATKQSTLPLRRDGLLRSSGGAERRPAGSQ